MATDPSIPLGVQQFKFNPFEQLGQIREQQQRRQLNDQAIRSNQALEEERRNKIAADQRLAASTATIDGLMQKAMVPDPDTGIFTFDRSIAERGIVESGQGHLLPTYLQHFDALDKSTREAAEKTNGAIAKALMTVTASGNTAGAALGMVAYLKKNRLMTDEHMQPILQSLAEDDSPENVAKLVSKYGDAIPQYRELQNAETKRKSDLAHTDATTANLAATTAKTAAETAQIGKPPVPKNLDEALFAATQTKDGPEVRRLLNLIGQKNAAGRAPTQDNEPLVSIMGPDGKPVLVRRSQAEGKTPASTREQGRPVSAAVAGDLADFDTSLDELSAVRAAISPKDSTGIVARVGATLPYVTQLTGWGEDAKKRQAVIDRVKQVIGKTLEGGVLRKEDEAKYEKILPNIGDAPDVAKSKLDGLEAAITKRKQRLLDNLGDANFDVSKQTQRGGTKKIGRFDVVVEP